MEEEEEVEEAAISPAVNSIRSVYKGAVFINALPLSLGRSLVREIIRSNFNEEELRARKKKVSRGNTIVFYVYKTCYTPTIL